MTTTTLPNELQEVVAYLMAQAQPTLVEKLHLGVRKLGGASPTEGGREPLTTSTTTQQQIASLDENAWVSLPEVSFISPRGSFVVDFGADFVQLRGKAGTFRREKSEAIAAAVVQLPADPKTNQSRSFFIRFKDGSFFLASPKPVGGAKGATTPLIKGGNFEKMPHELSSRIAQQADPASGTVSCTMKKDDLFMELLSASIGGSTASSSSSSTGGFRSTKNESWMACNYKTVNAGRLFPLREGLLFMQSPLVYLPATSIQSVHTNPATSRTFDLSVVCNTTSPSGTATTTHEFSMLDANELGGFLAYVKENKIGVRGDGNEEKAGNDDDDDEEEDEDDDDDDDDTDPTYVDSDEEDSSSDDGEEQEEGGDDDAQKAGDSEDGSSESDDDDDDDDDEDEDEANEDTNGEVAALVEEEPLEKSELDVILPEGTKRRRRA